MARWEVSIETDFGKLKKQVDNFLKEQNPLAYTIQKAREKIALSKEKERIKQGHIEDNKRMKAFNEFVEKVIGKLGSLEKAVGSIKFEGQDLSPEFASLRKAIEKIKIPEFSFEQKDITPELKKIQKAVENIKIPTYSPVSIPDSFKLEGINDLDRGLNNILMAIKKQKPVDNKDIVKEIKALQKEIGKVKFPEVEFPDSISVNNFPPQKVPNPVTNININPLRGYIHTTNQTLTTSRSTIPSYGVLNYRRSLIVYNNSSSTTVYLGGTGVTANDGIPLPPKSYSPALDAGPRMILYGLTSSGTADIRVMELSNEDIGG